MLLFDLFICIYIIYYVLYVCINSREINTYVLFIFSYVLILLCSVIYLH